MLLMRGEGLQEEGRALAEEAGLQSGRMHKLVVACLHAAAALNSLQRGCDSYPD